MNPDQNQQGQAGQQGSGQSGQSGQTGQPPVTQPVDQTSTPGSEGFSPPWLNFQPTDTTGAEQPDAMTGDTLNAASSSPVRNPFEEDTAAPAVDTPGFLQDQSEPSNPFATFTPEPSPSPFDPFANPFAPAESTANPEPITTNVIPETVPPIQTTPEEPIIQSPEVITTPTATVPPVVDVPLSSPTSTSIGGSPTAEVTTSAKPVDSTPAAAAPDPTRTSNAPQKPAPAPQGQRLQQNNQQPKQEAKWKDKKKDQRDQKPAMAMQNEPQWKPKAPADRPAPQSSLSSLDILENFYQTMLAEEERYKRDLDDLFDQINEENTRHRDEIAALEEQKRALRNAHKEKNQHYKDMLGSSQICLV